MTPKQDDSVFVCACM